MNDQSPKGTMRSALRCVRARSWSVLVPTAVVLAEVAGVVVAAIRDGSGELNRFLSAGVTMPSVIGLRPVARRNRRSFVWTVLASTALCLAWSAPAQAAHVTLGFDDQPGGTKITGQYAGDGVEFGQFTGGAAGNAFVVRSSPAEALSPPNVLSLAACGGGDTEFPSCTTDNYIHFDAPQEAVSFYLGFLHPSATPAAVQVTAFDASGVQVASANPTVGPGIHAAVKLKATSGGHGVVFVHIQQAEHGDAVHDTALDNLAFDNGPSSGPEISVKASGEVFVDSTGAAAATGTTTLTFGRFGGSTGAVALDISALPAGLSASFAPSTFTGGAGASDLLTLTAAPGTPGTPVQSVTVTATPVSAAAGSHPASTTFQLHVLNAYSVPNVAVSLAQAAGDPAQTGSSGTAVAYHGVPLVSGRDTLARVFADPSGLIVPGTSGLTAKLYGRVGAQSLPGSPLHADQGGPPALSDQIFDDQLGQSTTSFNFVLPRSWTTAGPITLDARVSGPGAGGLAVGPDPAPSATGFCAGCDASHPTTLNLTSVTFAKVPVFIITPVQLTWNDAAQSNKLRTPGDPQAALKFAYETAPISAIVPLPYAATIDITGLQGFGVQSDLADAGAQGMVVQWARDQYANTGDGPMFGNLVMGFNDALARGFGQPAISLGTDGNGNPVFEPVSTVDVNREISSVPHELGHDLGRAHADHDPTCGGAGSNGTGSDPLWPDYSGHFEPTADEANGMASAAQTGPLVNSYGVDLNGRAGGLATAPLFIYPSTSYDFMSYCAGVPDALAPLDLPNPPGPGNPGSDWISARGWQQELQCVQSIPAPGCPINQSQPSSAAGAASSATSAHVAKSRAHVARSPAAPRDPVISFVGYLQSDGTLLASSLMPTTGGAARVTASSFVATLVDAAGHVVSSEPLSGQPVHLEGSRGHPLVPLTALEGFLPTHGRAVASVTLSDGTREIAHIFAPAHTPRVQVRLPRIARGASTFNLTWRTSDPDRGERTAFVAVSAGPRGRYTTIWEGLDRGHAALPVAALTGSGHAAVRVRVNDGFHASTGIVRLAPPPVARPRPSKAPAWKLQLQALGIRVLRAP